MGFQNQGCKSPFIYTASCVVVCGYKVSASFRLHTESPAQLDVVLGKEGLHVRRSSNCWNFIEGILCKATGGAY